MRTTLTLDDEVAVALHALARERGTSFKATVNEVLRRGLSSGEKPPPVAAPFRVPAKRRGFKAGIDPHKLNQLLDELDGEAFVDRAHTATRTW